MNVERATAVFTQNSWSFETSAIAVCSAHAEQLRAECMPFHASTSTYSPLGALLCAGAIPCQMCATDEHRDRAR